MIMEKMKNLMKFHNPFVTKSDQKQPASPDQGTSGTPVENFTLHSERQDASPPKVRDKRSAVTIQLHTVPEVLASTVRQENEKASRL